jgi:hypothetical protein
LVLETRGLSSNVLDNRREYKVVKHFSRIEMVGWILGVIPLPFLTTPDLERILIQEITAANGDEVINIQIKDETGLFNIAINTLAQTFIFGIGVLFGTVFFDTRTVTIEGDVIIYQ